MKKPIGVSRLFAEMGDQAGRAREDRHAANERSGNVEIAQRRGDRHRDVHRQRLAPDPRHGAGQARRAVDAASGDAALARQRDHPLGARIDRLVQGMAEPRHGPARRAPLARDLLGGFVRRRAGVDARQDFVDQRAREIGRARESTVPQPSTPAATAP